MATKLRYSKVDLTITLITLESQFSTDNGRDYNIFPRKTISVSPTKPQSISMWLIRDGIGFEGEESFQLQLSKKSGADVFLQNNITVVIIDKDGEKLSAL